MDDIFYMKEAIKEAKLSLERGDYPIGCVVVLDDEIILRDGNRGKSNNFLSHAEINSLMKLSREFVKKNKNKLEIYTTYEPCPMCFGAIVQIYAKKLVYGINLEKSGATSLITSLPDFYDFNRRGRLEIVGGILEEECRDIFMKSDYAQELIKKGLIQKK